MSVQIMSENTASDGHGHGQEEDILVLKCKHWYTDCVWVAALAGGIHQIWKMTMNIYIF